MRTPDVRLRIGGESIREIVRGLRDETSRLRDLEIQATNRALEPSHVLNAVVLWYLGFDADTREVIARAAVRRYREHLESDEPIQIRSIPIDVAVGSERSAPIGLGAVSTGKVGQKRKAQGKNHSTNGA